jgi:transcriptional regulator with XRE-family HTH domain
MEEPMQPQTEVTQLKAARVELGWTQTRAISALMTEAKTAKVNIAEPTSLKTMLSRWENGVGQPDKTYQRLFSAVYQRDVDELGFTTPTGRVDGSARIAPVLDDNTVAYFRDVFVQHIRADNLMGPHHLVDVVRAQAALLDQVLTGAKADVRNALTHLACRYNEFTGWLYQDAGDPKNAMYYTDRAMDYALGDDNPTQVAYLLMRKTNITNDMVNPSRALGLSDAGMRNHSRVAPRIRALILIQRARAHALDGDQDNCARAIDSAYHEVSHSDPKDDDIAKFCTTEYIQMEAAATWTALGKADRAVPILEQALATWPTQMRRDLGLCQTRLAIAHASAGNVAAAGRIGNDAVTTASAATSARTLRDLNRLRGILAPWRRDEEVSELTDRIRQLTRAA